MSQPVFGVSDQFRHKLAGAATEDGYRLEINDLERREMVLFICSENKDADQLHGYRAALF